MARSLTLGPIVGADTTRALLWFKDVPVAKYFINLAKPMEAATQLAVTTLDDATCVVPLNNLEPDMAYEYTILSGTSNELLASGRFATFPFENAVMDFSFAFFSCHKPAEDRAMVMWDRLSGLCHGASQVRTPNALRFALAIGDQIYADELGTTPKQYLQLDRMSLDGHFDARYNYYWQLRSVRDVFSHCPMYMMWDDHEIRDGWGSRKRDLSTRQLIDVYKAAEEAFIRHQLSHNPFCPSPDTAKYYSFRFAQAGFIVTDLRGERNSASKRIMSADQWNWLSHTLQTYSQTCRVVFVVIGVPFYHPVRGLAKAVSDLKNLFSKDEMEDSWSAKQWQNEGIRLAKLLFDVQSAPGRRAQLFLLGGDAHIATCAEIRLGTDQQAVVIPQFTSSAISNASPAVLKKVKGNIQDRSWRRLYDNQQFEARIPHLVAARNFGIVHVGGAANGQCNVRFDLQHEESDAHVTLYDNGLVLPPIVIA